MPNIMINGRAGRIEAKLSFAERTPSPCAVLLHPHPQHGGTMHNKVIYTMYKAFTSMGFSVLRFNFRGVGMSEGEYDEGIGELNDAACIIDWIEKNHPKLTPLWVGGFSFGAWIGMQILMRRPELRGFVCVNPPANLYDFSFLSPCPVQGQIIQGLDDKIVTPSSVEELTVFLKEQNHKEITLNTVEDADHFFTNKLDILEECIIRYVSSQLSFKSVA
jgi:alpha/beta superfamily hydrolase